MKRIVFKDIKNIRWKGWPDETIEVFQPANKNYIAVFTQGILVMSYADFKLFIDDLKKIADAGNIELATQVLETKELT